MIKQYESGKEEPQKVSPSMGIRKIIICRTVIDTETKKIMMSGKTWILREL